MIGDSTGLGVGASHPDRSLPGLLAADFSHADVTNLCRSGARVGDLLCPLAQLAARCERFDLVLVMAGGNDVLRLGLSAALLKSQARLLTNAVAGLAPHAVWLGCADIGLSPVFLPPFSWLLRWRTRHTMRMLAREAERRGVDFIDFSTPHWTRRFGAERHIYFAADGVHPTEAAYRVCYDAVRERLRSKRVSLTSTPLVDSLPMAMAA